MSADTSFQRQALQGQKLAKTQRRRQAFAAERRVAEATTTSRRNDLLPSLRVRMAPIGELKTSPHRTRTTTPGLLERLIKSIGTLGINRPILVRAGEIIDGHICLDAARRLGLAQVPVIDCDHLSATEARQLRLALNRTAFVMASGEMDVAQFSQFLTVSVALSVTHLVPGGVMFGWMDWRSKRAGCSTSRYSCP